MIQSSACQPWHVDPPGLAGEYGGLVGTYTISWDTIGVEEGSDALDRYYSYLSRDELIAIWAAAGPWKSIEADVWLGGAYDRKPTTWVAITASK
jgi:hypothetical protein